MQTTCEVTRVGSTKSGINEALTSTRSCNEVLKCFQAFTEVALNWTRNHVTTRVGHESAHTCNLTHLGHVSTSTRGDHHVNRVVLQVCKLFLHCLLNFASCFCPNTYFLLTTLTVGDDSAAELLLHLVGIFFVTIKNCALCFWSLYVINRNGQTGLRCIAVAQVFNSIESQSNFGLCEVVAQTLHDHTEFLLLQSLINMSKLLDETSWQTLFEQQTTWRGVHVDLLAVVIALSDFDLGVKFNVATVKCTNYFVQLTVNMAFALHAVALIGEVIPTNHQVLLWGHNWTTRGWRQNVVRTQHQHACFSLSFNRQWQVNCHLVTVEVSVKRCTYEWVQLNCLALNEQRFECLNSQAVQRRSTVQQNWVFLNDVFKNVPHLWPATLNHALCTLNVLCKLLIDQTLHNEWLEQFECHQLRQTALLQAQCWAGNDY